MLTTAKSANIGFSQVVQLFAPPTNPAYAPRAKIPFINWGKNFLGVHNVRISVRKDGNQALNFVIFRPQGRKIGNYYS